MSYGHLSLPMEDTLRPFIQDRVVWDLGSGDFGYTLSLLDLGAARIVAVDKEISRRPIPTRVEFRQCYFEHVRDLPEATDVVFLGFPQTNPAPGLVRLLEAVRTVVYLGNNTHGTVCGQPDVWRHLTAREILAHNPIRRNSLIVYGAEPRSSPLVGEEYAALHPHLMMTFQEAQDAVSVTRAPESSP